MNTQSIARTSRAAQVPSPLAHRSAICISQRISKSDRVSTRAFLSNLFGGGAKGGSTTDPRGAELRNELVLLTLNTNYGAGASNDKKKEIAETVRQLAKYSVKSPLKSSLLWGDYEVLYSSSASAEASLLGSGKLSGGRQVLEAPNKLTNVSEFKTFGVLPGFAKQFGEIQPVSDDTFTLKLTRSESKGGLGGVETKPLDITRRVKIAYLDASLRVVSILPGLSTTTLIDDEFDEEPDKQEVLLVFRRVAASQDKAVANDDEEEEEEEAAPPPQPLGTQIFGRFLPTAVTVEEEDEDDVKVTKRGSANLKWAKQQVSSQQARDEKAKGTAVTKQTREQQEAQRAKQQEVARREAEVAKARAEQERAKAAAEREKERARAEAEKEKDRQRAAAIKAQQQELAEDAKEAAAAVREAVADLKAFEREGGPALKSVAAAESQLSKAAADVQAAEEELADAAAQRRAAEAALKQALAEVAEAEAELRSISRK